MPNEDFDFFDDSDEVFDVAVIDPNAIRLVSFPHAFDLEAFCQCLSDDPTHWEDITQTWERHHESDFCSPSVESIPHKTISKTELKQWVRSHDDWTVIDLIQCRTLSARLAIALLPFSDIPEEMSNEEIDNAIQFDLPPWWLHIRNATPIAVTADRETPVMRVDPQRDVLWGNELIQFLAHAMIHIDKSGTDWKATSNRGVPAGRFLLTQQIHKDWLMTPRTSLNGDTPRMRLHIAKDWIDDRVHEQFSRLERGEISRPLPHTHSSYAKAPLGTHEIVIYFDACRATIEAGWQWLIKKSDDQCNLTELESQLAEHLQESLTSWLDTPYEGPTPPRVVIETERQRMPLIEGSLSHETDCECPICNLQSSLPMGIPQTIIDGYHLESEDEFAFSLSSSESEWQQEQDLTGMPESDSDEYDEDEDDEDWGIDDEFGDDEFGDDDDDDDDWDEDDDYESTIWKTTKSKSIPGDFKDQLQMTFKIAEFAGRIATLPNKNKWTNSEKQSKVLNAKLMDYQKLLISDGFLSKVRPKAEALKNELESIAKKYPDLRAQASDLQSLIDEQLRSLPPR